MEKEINQEMVSRYATKAEATNTEQQNNISYNFTNLLDDLSDVKGDVIESVSFKTVINAKGEVEIDDVIEIDDRTASKEVKDFFKVR